MWAAATMCVFGFLRVGEIMSPQDGFDVACHLAQGDVRVNDLEDPKFVVVRTKASRTDPFCECVSVYVGRTGSRLCRVAAIFSYMGRQRPLFQA